MKKKLLICAVALCSTPTWADDVGQWYINPQVGYLITDPDRARDNNWLYGLGVGNNLSQHLSLEVNANSNRFYSDTAPSLELTGVSFDALLYFTRARIAPYLVLGAGVIQDNLEPAIGSAQKNQSFMAEGGFGVRALLWESADKSRSFSLRPEVKARYDDVTAGHYTDYVGMLGFQFGFGTPPVVAAAPVAPPPAEPAPPPPPPPPAPAADSDHDGVPDDRDRCPDTAPGVMVDAVGCEQKGSVTLEGVTFEFDSATLTAASKPVLDVTADGLKKHPRVRVELQGHTDSKGADAYNLKLSQRRADSVRDYLGQQGVPENQLTAKGYGEAQPVADNKTEEGRAKNRRVVMKVLDNPRDVQVKGAGEAEKTAN